MKPRVLVFASGTKEGGGSGFENLVKASREGILDAEIVAVVSNHEHGGVRQRADRLGVPFIYFTGDYPQIVKDTKADWVMLSGWLKLVKGLDPKRTVNIHPGPLPRFGGPGMYGRHVHEVVLDAFRRGEITHSAVTMHFVNEEYDKGEIIFQKPVEILPNDTPNTLAARVLVAEHFWQPRVLNDVIHSRNTHS